MTPDQNEAERLLQAAAEAPANPHEAGDIARHRYVLHAIRQLPIPSPPAGFVRQIESCLQDHPEDAAAERWLLRIATAAALVLGVATVGPWLLASSALLTTALGDVPWRLLMVTAAGLAGFAIFDALRQRRGSH